MNEQVLDGKIGIYDESQMTSLQGYYGRDIIKVLSKNPKEVFIFWGISMESFSTIRSFFQVPLEEIQYKLHIRYSDETKHIQFLEVRLSPFTTSYVLKFDSTVRNLRVEVIAYNSTGSTYSLMHSAHVNTPINRPSPFVHHEWIHPKWIEHGNFIEKQEEFFIIKGINKSSQEIFLEEQTPVWEPAIVFDGSSGYSSHSIPSSIRKKKE